MKKILIVSLLTAFALVPALQAADEQAATCPAKAQNACCAKASASCPKQQAACPAKTQTADKPACCLKAKAQAAKKSNPDTKGAAKLVQR